MGSSLSSFDIKVAPPAVVEKKDLGDYDKDAAKPSKADEKQA